MHKKLGFTLAEVLITLGIIGIVAALTIPALMNNIQDAQYRTAYKKAYSTANQAWLMAYNEDKIISRTGWIDDGANVANFNAFKSEMKVTKDCNSNNNIDCWPIGDYFFLDLPDANALAFIDTSGMTWSLSNSGGSGSELLVDVNGPQKPNKYGQDRFYFQPVTADGNTATPGVPIKLKIPNDFSGYDATHCPSGASHPCWYQSWITGEH